MPQKTKPKPRKTWIPIVVILVLVAAGAGGYYYWQQQQAKATAKNSGTTFNTSTVRRGNISLSASGSGTLVPSQSDSLTFATSGTVAKVSVQVGDEVKKDQVLATLANTDQLQASVASAQQDLIAAQQALDTLKQNAASNLANAQLKLSQAQKAVTDAQSAVVQPGWTRCDQATTDAYYSTYLRIKAQLDALGDGGGNQSYYLTTIVPMKNKVAQAYAQYEYCAGYTTYEVDSSNATLALAKANVTVAQTTLDTLTKNGGVDPTALAQAQNKVDNAQAALDTANQNLTGSTIKAPYDGTILTVNGQAGDTVGTSAFISIADLAHPQVQFSVDETDLDKVAMNEQATVVFDAYPTLTFTGTVVRVNPQLVSSNNVQVIQGLIQIDLSKQADPPIFAQGLNATVTLVHSQSNNTLLVPLAAIHDLGDGTYGVFVVGKDGQPRLKVVEIGLQDSASAEVKSGLSVGDVVTTGQSAVRNPGQ